MGVFSAVAGNQLPNPLQKRVLPALFHLRCPSQSHQRSARGRTRLTTVTSISCRSFQRQLLCLLFFLSSFFLTVLSFSVFPFLVPFPFVSSFRLVVFRLVLASPSSPLFLLPCFPWWRIMLFCYFVSALHPPHAPCEPEVCAFPLPAVFFLALLMLT